MKAIVHVAPQSKPFEPCSTDPVRAAEPQFARSTSPSKCARYDGDNTHQMSAHAVYEMPIKPGVLSLQAK